MKIEKITENKDKYMSLLLLGDESEEMINKYLNIGDMYALFDPDVRGVSVVTKVDSSTCELKNLATKSKYQGKGYGSKMVSHLFHIYKNDYEKMLVGTGNNPKTLGFYKNLGFKESHIIKDFFIKNYPEPIFEEGNQLIDMIYLTKQLKKADD